MMNMTNKKKNPLKLAESLNDSSLFLKRQLKEEKALNSKLDLTDDIKERINARHSLAAITQFLTDYAAIIERQRYLYELPQAEQSVLIGSVITFPWCPSEKVIYSLESHNYCLFSREEYTAALSAGISRGLFLNIGHRVSLKEHSARRNSRPAALRVKVKKEEPVEPEPFVDVLGDTEEDEPVVVVKSQSLKRPATLAHLDKIRSYEGECGADEEAKPVSAEPERGIERYTKQEEAQEDLKQQVERFAYHLRLEQEIRILEGQRHARAIAKLQRDQNEMLARMDEKDKEIARLRQGAAATTKAPARVVKAKRATTSSKKTEPVQQQLDGFMVTTLALRPHSPPPEERPRQQPRPQQKSPKQLAKEAERAYEVTVQHKFDDHARQMAQWYETYDDAAHQMLTPFTEGSETNIGLSLQYPCRLTVYLEKFLEATQIGNRHLRDLVDHPFLANYRIQLLPNMTHFEGPQAAVFLTQKREVLDRDSLAVRFNLSNINIHANFLCKAIQFSEPAAKLGYRPVILQNFPYTYSPQITRDWYPRIDAGNGYLVTVDLKLTAVCTEHGQGRGKRCCFCGLEYIACSNGVLKHTHQVTSCDYLANCSNDERVVLETVNAKRAVYAKFAKHEFISTYSEKSLLRLATPEEVERGLFVIYAKTQEHIRLNMPVFLQMRQEVYNEFLLRIDSLDTHQDNKNLNARPTTSQLDCFGHTVTVPAMTALATPPKPKKAPTTKRRKYTESTKTRKEDGFLYKTLMDHDGGQFRKTKFAADGKETLRDFTINPLTGFGDDMYFSEALPVYTLEKAEEVDRNCVDQLAQNAAFFAAVNDELLTIMPVEGEQQRAEQEEEEGGSMTIDYSSSFSTTTTSSTTNTSLKWGGGEEEEHSGFGVTSFGSYNEFESNNLFQSPSNNYSFQDACEAEYGSYGDYSNSSSFRSF